MQANISTETFKAALFEILEETFEDVHGIYLDRGTSLFETLETITAEQASRPISERCASMAAQVRHVAFYLDVLERYLRTRASVKVDWGEIWRTTRQATPEEWQAYQVQLRQSYQRVFETLRKFENWDNEDSLSGAMATVVHSAYHLGEIRQALCILHEGPTPD
jgi:hypothetical protein